MKNYAEDAKVSLRMHERSSTVEEDYFIVELTDAVNGDRLMEVKFDAAELMRAVVGMSSATGSAVVRRSNENLNKIIIAASFNCEQAGIERFEDDTEQRMKNLATMLEASFGFDESWVSKTNSGFRGTLRGYAEAGSERALELTVVKEKIENAADGTLKALLKGDE